MRFFCLCPLYEESARQHCLCFVQSDAIWKFSQSHVQIWLLTYDLTDWNLVSPIHETCLNDFKNYRATTLPTFVGYMLPLHVLFCPKVSSPKMIMRSFDKLTSNVRVLMEITFSVKQDTWQINWKIQTWNFASFHFTLTTYKTTSLFHESVSACFFTCYYCFTA